MSKPKDVAKQIRKATLRKFSAEDKIRIVLEGLRGQIATSDLCRRETPGYKMLYGKYQIIQIFSVAKHPQTSLYYEDSNSFVLEKAFYGRF